MTDRPAYDVAIIGGGASGLAAAVSAGRSGERVVLIERDVACGLPILATGNGRCNLSNMHLDPARYRHPDVARTVMRQSPETELCAFFDSIGLMTCAVGDRMYPFSKRADSVRDALLLAAEPLCAETVCCAQLERATFYGNAWHLEVLEPEGPLRPHIKHAADFRAVVRARRRELARAPMRTRELRARRVIIACGGSSERISGLFGIPHLEEEPVLCPVACTVPGAPRALAELDGLRVDGRLSCLRAGKVIWSETGEVLFRAFGISGIVAFDLSRIVQAGDMVELDLFPSRSEPELVELFQRRTEAMGDPARAGSSWFAGMLASGLGTHIVSLAERTGQGCTCSVYAHLAKHLPFAASGTTEHASAQVRRGGIPFDAVDLPTLAIRADIAPALYACGEALDMDADCGGFNLAWAWLSGLRAGRGTAAH